MTVHHKAANDRGSDNVEHRPGGELLSAALEGCKAEVAELKRQLHHAEEEMRVWRVQAVALRHEIDIVLQASHRASAPNGQTPLHELVKAANWKARVKTKLMPFWRRVPELMKPSLRSLIRWLIRHTIG